MTGATDERWKQLCAQAAAEQDPKKLAELIVEISNLLDQRFEPSTLRNASKTPPAPRS